MAEKRPNTGAAFKPKEEQSLLLTGRLDIDGQQDTIALMKDTDYKGNAMIGVFKRIGVLYEQEDATEENKKPQYSGSINQDKRIAAWRQHSDTAGKYLSLKISEKQQQSAPQKTDFKDMTVLEEVAIDDIPF